MVHAIEASVKVGIVTDIVPDSPFKMIIQCSMYPKDLF